MKSVETIASCLMICEKEKRAKRCGDEDRDFRKEPI